MSGLAKTVAEVMARARSMEIGQRPSPLRERTAFGDNPGALRMWVYAPEDLPALPAMIVVLHGCGQTAAAFAEDSGWLELADRYGFVVLCPEQARSNNPNLCFNWFNPQDTRRESGEAASIAAMVKQAKIDHRVDPGRVFVTGLSAGGAMTAAMLATHPDLFAGGAIIAGLPYGAAANLPQALSAMKAVPQLSARAWGDKLRHANPAVRRWPKVTIWHGDADTTVAPGAADALVAQWTDVHGLDRGQDVETSSARHRHQRWQDPSGETLVEVHRITGLGHGVPIAAGGEDGCGKAAPWVLEAGLSSSLEMARVWGLTGSRCPSAAHRTKPAGRTSAQPEKASRLQSIDVNAVISAALRRAGLDS